MEMDTYKVSSKLRSCNVNNITNTCIFL